MDITWRIPDELARLIGATGDLERDQQELDRLFPDEARREKARQAAANIIARRKGVTLGDLKIKDLIDEGRP